MIRMILFVLVAIFGALALWKLVEYVRTRNWDWTGIAFAIGFVVLAFWLRQVTGMGD